MNADGSKDLVLVAVYRPPVDKMILELPGGLVDEGEEVEAAGFRELKEETGFTASKVIPAISKLVQFSSPWTTCEAQVIFGVEIDGTLECNQEPK